MSTLINTRHERFAQELAAGKSAIEAHRLAGYRADRGAASRMQHRSSISQRVAEILADRDKATGKAIARTIERTAITKQRVIDELAKIGFANMLDYMRIGSNGDPILDFSAITRDQAAALVEVTVEDFRDGRGNGARDVRRVKFKLADKRSALVDIGKELGMFISRLAIEDARTAADLTDDELADIARGGRTSTVDAETMSPKPGGMVH